VEISLPSDASVEEICDYLWQEYAAAIAGASSCSSILDCSHAVVNRMSCTCTTYVSDPSVEGALAGLVAAYDEHHCGAGVACGACPWEEIPVCVEGICRAREPSCDELTGLYAQAMVEARGCTEGDQCTGQAYASTQCQCEVPLNGDAWAGFFDVAWSYWDWRQCPVPPPCDCLDVGLPDCVDGLCEMTQPAGGSTSCSTGEECEPVAGCACGCWSEPPESPGMECPCAAPEACVCNGGQCKEPFPGSDDCLQDEDCFPLDGCDCGCWSQAPLGEDSEITCACEGPPGCFCNAAGKCEGLPWE